MNFTFSVDNHTTFEMIERTMDTIFSKKREVILNIDASKCTTFRFKTIMRLVPLLEKYHKDSHKYLKHTTIIVSNPFMTNVVNFSLQFIDTPSPVNIYTLSKL